MTDLFEKSIQTLELPRVLGLLADQAVTEEGKERCRALRPLTDADDVQRRLAETSAALSMLVLRGTPSLSGVKPVAAALQRADMGGALNTRELLDIAALLRCARSARDYATGEGNQKTCIDHLFASLTANRFLEDKISGSILGEDEIADAASPELADIRRHIRASASKVRDILQKLISSSQAKYLQESIITMRSGRYVVPVKAEHKNDVPGLVHDVSGSGGTFFIEPMGVVKTNNELRELQAREEKVDRFWAMDCSSPISASTWSKAITRLSSATGMWRPHWAISVRRPMVLRVTVLPPVLGPVMTSVSKPSPSRRSLATALAGSSRGWRAFFSSIPSRPSLGSLASIRVDSLARAKITSSITSRS